MSIQPAFYYYYYYYYYYYCAIKFMEIECIRCSNVQTKCYDNRILFQKLILEKERQCIYSVTMKRVRTNIAAQKSN
jgi:hypothetical protein